MRGLWFSVALASLGLAASAAGAAPTPNAAVANAAGRLREKLEQDLFDYPGTRFLNVSAEVVNKDLVAFCGQINGKNRLGGYIGWRPFLGMVSVDDVNIYSLPGNGRDEQMIGVFCAGKDHPTSDYSASVTYR
jgi:hypothetical protein